MALIKVGNSPKTTIDDDYIQLVYKNGHDFLLTQHCWTFAKKYGELSLMADYNAIGFKYAYRLPSDIAKISSTYPYSRFDILSGILVSDINPLSLVYTSIDIIDLFPNYFGLAFGAYIAKEIALIIKADTSLNAMLYNDYIQSLNEAINIDSGQISSIQFTSNRYIDIR